MKTIAFGYTMVKIDHELGTVTETRPAGTQLTMTDDIANAVIKGGTAAVPLSIRLTLSHIAELQGYTLGSIDYTY